MLIPSTFEALNTSIRYSLFFSRINEATLLNSVKDLDLKKLFYHMRYIPTHATLLFKAVTYYPPLFQKPSSHKKKEKGDADTDCKPTQSPDMKHEKVLPLTG
jgi:hypothetical protein